LLFPTVAVQTCLYAKRLLSNGCCIFAYLAVVVQQQVYMPHSLDFIISSILTSIVFISLGIQNEHTVEKFCLYFYLSVFFISEITGRHPIKADLEVLQKLSINFDECG
jgi:hypothetical protein